MHAIPRESPLALGLSLITDVGRGHSPSEFKANSQTRDGLTSLDQRSLVQSREVQRRTSLIRGVGVEIPVVAGDDCLLKTLPAFIVAAISA